MILVIKYKNEVSECALWHIIRKRVLYCIEGFLNIEKMIRVDCSSNKI